MYEVVIASKSKTYLFNYPTKCFVPADMHVIEMIKTMLQNENAKKEPKTWALKINFECIEKARPQPKPRSRVQPKSTSMPKIDLTDVPQHLLFIASEGFKDQALEFERELSFVQPSSDRGWVKRRFVDGLSTWPHIKNADDALNGIISQALSIVAENPHFPPWWRSIGVSLMRGNPKGLIRSCLSVIDYSGDIKQPVSIRDGAWFRNIRMPNVNDDQAILSALRELWDMVRFDFPRGLTVFRVSVTLYDLSSADARQIDLLNNDDVTRQKWEKASTAIDSLNSRYSKTIVSLGEWKPPAGGHVGGKSAMSASLQLRTFGNDQLERKHTSEGSGRRSTA